MRIRVTALTALLTCGLGAAIPANAQQCGYYAILGCFQDSASAFNWNERIEFGRVIRTGSDEYPNFRPGYYCVVHGPTSSGEANHVMRRWRSIVPDAYVKNAC